MKIGVLTSSRADYGIYLPLLKQLKADPFFDLHIIAFGTHLSKAHGHTADQITKDGFGIAAGIDTMPEGDSPEAISAAMGKTITNFSSHWSQNQYDLVIALGDRYEMFAACASSIPFGIKLAHIHGGETTLGAIDDALRHGITHMAGLHFTTTDTYSERVKELKGSPKGIYNVGALSIDNLKTMPLLSKEEFLARFNINLNKASILITFHPETVAFEKNEEYVNELVAALRELKDYQLIITMPNADTMGNMIRGKLNAFIENAANAIGVESFGALGYLSCMKHCTMMLGNTSSGFVEAAFFPKYVINLGERQTGRIITSNICTVAIKKDEILEAVSDYKSFSLSPVNIYGDGNTAQKIADILKQTA